MKAHDVALVAANSTAWHNGYRAACKDICERFGLDNTDEIELLVKERDALKANNEWMDKEFVRLNAELQAAKIGRKQPL